MQKWLAGVGAAALTGSGCTVFFYVMEQGGTQLPPSVTSAITFIACAVVGYAVSRLS